MSGQVPKDPNDVLREAESLFRLQDLEGSWESFAFLAKYPSYRAEAYLGLASICVSRTQFDEAERHLHSAWALKAREPRIFLMLGDIAEKRGDLASAAARYSESLVVDPNFVAAQRRLDKLRSSTAEKAAPILDAKKSVDAPQSARMSSQFIGNKYLTGTVDGLSARSERLQFGTNKTTTVLTFRLKSDKELKPIELRGNSLRGVLADGDEVAILKNKISENRGGIILYNLTTGGAITRGPLLPLPKEVRPPPGIPKLSKVRGTVAGYSIRKEYLGLLMNRQAHETAVISFRLKVVPTAGKEFAIVPVEMRGTNEIRGIVRNGDDIEISNSWTWGQTLTPRKIFNHSTNSSISTDATDLSRRLKFFVRMIFIIAFIIIALIFMGGR